MGATRRRRLEIDCARQSDRFSPCGRSSARSTAAPPATTSPGSPFPPAFAARAAVRAGDVGEAFPPRTRTRASRCTSARCRHPSSPPTRSTSQSWPARSTSTTVWTSIFEPLPTFGFLDRLGKESVWGARHAQDFHVVGSDVRRGRAGGVGSSELEARRPSRSPLQLRRRPGPVRTRRLDAGRQPTDLGLRIELRRPRRSRGRQGQPGHAQACAPHLGGGGGQRALRLDQLPDARRAPCRSHEAGRQRLHLGATGGIGAPARPARPQRRSRPSA